MNVKRFFTIAGLLASAIALLSPMGCAPYTAPVKPPRGALIDVIQAPLTTNAKDTPCGSALKKYSKSSTYYFYDPIFTGLSFAWDDVQLARIARAGGIRTVAYADYQRVSILGIYAKFTVNIYGN